MRLQKSYTTRLENVSTQWFLANAENQILGRLASQIASILRGKHRPDFSPHHDQGDSVVVVNAEKVQLTGKKLDQKTYYRHSGYLGGIRSKTAAELFDSAPTEVIRAAVKGMLPSGPLGYQMIKKLKVYAGDSHPHGAQNPTVLEFKG